MQKRISSLLLAACFVLSSCNLPVATPVPTNTADIPRPADTFTPLPLPSETFTPQSTEALLPTETAAATPSETPTSEPAVDHMDAVVTADLLSCRYGPGAEYLFLYGLRKGAKISLIGQTGGNNWAWVDGRNKCWVNVKYIQIEGDFHQLPVVYPEKAPLPRSPYYSPTTITKVKREGNYVTVMWLEIPLRPGDEEDDSMLHYIVEVWRCEGGRLIFDPLATNDTVITFVDEAGCSTPSHGNVYVQEKHGFAGPTVIPWP